MAKFVSHKKGAPKGAVAGRQNDAGEVFAVITVSDAGRVPGKAKGSQAWYSMGGKEHLTNDFEYIKCKNVQLVRSNGGAPPAGAIVEGQQKDGNHALAPCIAHSSHGDVPAKTLASGGKQAWYPFGGAEHCVESFSWLVTAGFKLKRKAKPPKTAIESRQKDGTTIYLALAQTPHGALPAKAAGDTAWYAHGGKEHTTKDFEYVCAKKYHTKEANAPSKPARCIECGQQNDGAGELVPVLCFTDQGEIFGKALRKGGNTAWYPYGGAEHTTSKFSYFELK